MLVARAARLFSNSRRLARRGQPRLGVLPLGLEGGGDFLSYSGGASGGWRNLESFTRSPGLASGAVAHSSARSSTCAALMPSRLASMIRRTRLGRAYM